MFNRARKKKIEIDLHNIFNKHSTSSKVADIPLWLETEDTIIALQSSKAKIKKEDIKYLTSIYKVWEEAKTKTDARTHARAYINATNKLIA